MQMRFQEGSMLDTLDDYSIPIIHEETRTEDIHPDIVADIDNFMHSNAYIENIAFINYGPVPIYIRTANGPVVELEPRPAHGLWFHTDKLVVRQGIRLNDVQREGVRKHNFEEKKYGNVRRNSWENMPPVRNAGSKAIKTTLPHLMSRDFTDEERQHYFYNLAKIIEDIEDSKEKKIILSKPFYVEVALKSEYLVKTSHPLDSHAIKARATNDLVRAFKGKYLRCDTSAFHITINDKKRTLSKKFIKLAGRIVPIIPVNNPSDEDGVYIYSSNIRDENTYEPIIELLESFPKGLDYVSEENGFFNSIEECRDGTNPDLIKKRIEKEILMKKDEMLDKEYVHKSKLMELEAERNVLKMQADLEISNNNKNISSLKTEAESLKLENAKIKSESEKLQMKIDELKIELDHKKVQLDNQKIKFDQQKIDFEKQKLEFEKEVLKDKINDRPEERAHQKELKKDEVKITRLKKVTEWVKASSDTIKAVGTAIAAVATIATIAVKFGFSKKTVDESPKLAFGFMSTVFSF